MEDVARIAEAVIRNMSIADFVKAKKGLRKERRLILRDEVIVGVAHDLSRKARRPRSDTAPSP